MTTLVETRQAVQLVSMGNTDVRKRPTRPAADLDNDDDFQFVRKSKRAKTADAPAQQPAAAAASPARQQQKQTRATSVPQPSPSGRRPTTRRSTRLSTPDGTEETTQPRPRPPPPQQQQQQNGRGARVADGSLFDSPPAARAAAGQSKMIALPMSDTPVINRNKEMRKKGGSGSATSPGGGGRRSSLGTRGRRASSLMSSGQTAIPHREVKTTEFYKHIEAEGLPEPRRMKALLTWCGERALSAKPKHGSKNAGVVHGARAIQDQLLKDFSARSDFSDWFSRDEEPDKAVVLLPNPRNTELDERMAQLEENIKRLQREKESWLAMRRPPPEVPPLLSDAEAQEPETITLPEFDLLDEHDGRIHRYLEGLSGGGNGKQVAGEEAAEPFEVVRARTQKRLRAVRATMELAVDQLADNVHKLERRVAVAGREADVVLGLSARRLREREREEKRRAGTGDMPIMEVLRSLGAMLPGEET